MTTEPGLSRGWTHSSQRTHASPTEAEALAGAVRTESRESPGHHPPAPVLATHALHRASKSRRRSRPSAVRWPVASWALSSRSCLLLLLPALL